MYNKQDLVKYVAKDTGFREADVEEVYTSLAEKIKEIVISGNKVKFGCVNIGCKKVDKDNRTYVDYTTKKKFKRINYLKADLSFVRSVKRFISHTGEKIYEK